MRYVIAVVMLLTCACKKAAPANTDEAFKNAFAQALQQAQSNDESARKATFANAVSVDAADLVALYKENELRADAVYRGKPLRVSGVVYNVERIGGKPVIRLGQPLRHAVAFIRESEVSYAMGLNRGERVTIEGLGAGATATGPRIEDATVVR